MSLIQLVVNNGTGWQAVDLPTDNSVKLSLYKAVQDFRDPLKATGAVSLPFTLPLTGRNRLIFNGDDDKQKLGKFKGIYQAQLLLDNELLLDGELTLSKIKANRGGFEVYIGQTHLLAPRIGDVVADKKLAELKSFQSLAFSGDSTIATAWDQNLFYPATEVCWPHVVRSFAQLQPQSTINGVAPMYHSGYESLGISHYCAAIVQAIFADAGYSVAGDIFSNEAFLKLVLLYSNSNSQPWNYGTLAPMRAHCLPNAFGGGVYEAGVQNTYERQSDMVQVLTYAWRADDGDLCEALGYDGVYTCKYGGLYTIRVSASHAYANGAQGNGGFTAFRCISDNEFMPEANLPGSFNAVPTLNSLDVDTLAVGGSSAFTFTVRLTEGKQYQVQRYVQFTQPTSAGSNSFLCYSPNEGNFFVSACDGPLTVNPALFLPDMTQQVFLKGIFKLFNLYYQLNEDTKTVTLFGRDDFFQETLQDIVDLSRHLSLDSMDETPFTEAEVAATYVTWATDESDYLLGKTDYLSQVNGIVPSGSTVLPFAPLGYVRVDYSTTAGTGTDMIPAIIPATDSEDTSVLTDETAVAAPGSWKPRLLLYQGNQWLITGSTYSFPATGNVTVTLGRQIPATQTVLGGFQGGGYPYTAYPPKVTFFNVSSQPVYEVVVNQALRSFQVSGYTGSTIYNPANPTFLADPAQVAQTLDYISLATNVDTQVNPLGFFSQLYGNDLLIDNLSNYFQGAGRMDSVLWNKLTGRQVLRVAQDLFLLDSIQNFDLNAKLATYRMYKLVSNAGTPPALPTSGGTSGATLLYSATMTATASCPTNTSGATKTATATRSSYVSQADADQKAYNAALQVATSQLVCTVTAWVGHGSVQAFCANGSYGHPNLVTATATSTISQTDANNKALDLAEQQANAGLVCYTSPQIGGNMLGNLITQIQGNLTPQASYNAAQALLDADMVDYYYAENATIRVSHEVYIQTQGYYYALVDGYYGFIYRVGNDPSIQGFHIVNGVVNDFIDTVDAGATGT